MVDIMTIQMKYVSEQSSRVFPLIAFCQPSHHIPYLYALSGAAWKTQERVREVAHSNYNNTPIGLSGVYQLSLRLIRY